MMRAISTTITMTALLAIAACSEPPPATPLAVAPEPAQITAQNADAAADALEKEIAADTE